MSLRLRPWTVKQGKPFVERVHRRLPKVQGAMWAISVRRGPDVVGCALVGNPSRAWMEDSAVLAVLRVACIEGNPNACSMLYGACSRAAKAMGADSLVTYTHADENGASLKASGWIDSGMTDGGEHDRPSRSRQLVIDPEPKRRWFAPWSKALAAPSTAAVPGERVHHWGTLGPDGCFCVHCGIEHGAWKEWGAGPCDPTKPYPAPGTASEAKP